MGADHGWSDLSDVSAARGIVRAWVVTFDRGRKGPMLIGVFTSEERAADALVKGAEVWETELDRNCLPAR